MLVLMKSSKSPKGHHSSVFTHAATNQSAIIGEGASPHPDKLRVEHEKLTHLQNQVTDMFLELRTSTIDEIYRSFGTDPAQLSDKEKAKDFEWILSQFQYLQKKLINYCKSVMQLSNNHAPINPSTVDIEEDIMKHKRENEKLKLLLESSNMRIKDAEHKYNELLTTKKNQVASLEKEINLLNIQLRDYRDSVNRTREDTILGNRESRTASIKQRATSSMKYQHSVDFDAPSRSMNATQSIGPEFFKTLAKEMDKSKLLNLQKKHEMADFKRSTDSEKVKELEAKQRENLISRLKIKVEERERDYALLKIEYERIHKELKATKEREAEMEREVWNKDLLSAANPIMQENLKKKLEEAKFNTDNLKKQVKKYALNEKKVYIKEKAFEYERAEYRDKLGYLQDRVIKLVKINEDLEAKLRDPTIKAILSKAYQAKKESNRLDDVEDTTQDFSVDKTRFKNMISHTKSNSKAF